MLKTFGLFKKKTISEKTYCSYDHEKMYFCHDLPLF
jgi:hypothetical protein